MKYKQIRLQDCPELKDFCDKLEFEQLKIEKYFYELSGGNGDYFYMEPDEINKKIEEHNKRIQNENIQTRL